MAAALTIHDQLALLQQHRASLALKIRNPRTDPRIAIETETELTNTDRAIADLREKIDTAFHGTIAPLL